MAWAATRRSNFVCSKATLGWHTNLRDLQCDHENTGFGIAYCGDDLAATAISIEGRHGS